MSLCTIRQDAAAQFTDGTVTLSDQLLMYRRNTNRKKVIYLASVEFYYRQSCWELSQLQSAMEWGR